MVLYSTSFVPPTSKQIWGISLRQSNVSRHRCIPCMQLMTGGATPNDWPKWLTWDYSRESGTGGWRKRGTVLVPLSRGPGRGPRVQGQAGARISHSFSCKWKLLTLFLLTLCIHTHAIYSTISFLGLSTKQKCQIFMLSRGNSASYFGLMHILSFKTEIFDTWFFMAVSYILKSSNLDLQEKSTLWVCPHSGPGLFYTPITPHLQEAQTVAFHWVPGVSSIKTMTEALLCTTNSCSSPGGFFL